MGMPETKALYYSEAVRQGGTLICVTVDDEMVPRVKEIIDSHGSIDINNLAAEWRKSGGECLPAEDEDQVVVQTTYVFDVPRDQRWAS